MTSSTMSRLSAPRSSMKLASSVTLSGSTPRCSTTIFFTRSAVSLMGGFLRLFFARCPSGALPGLQVAPGCAARYALAHERAPPDRRRNGPHPIGVRRCDRLRGGAADPPQVVAAAAAQRHHGPVGQPPFPPAWKRLVRGFLQGEPASPGPVHSRDDPCLASSDEGPLLPPPDAAPVLPLRLCHPHRLAAGALRARATGGDRQPRLHDASRRGRARRSAAIAARDDPAVSGSLAGLLCDADQRRA